jgi:hypothetical protein
MALMYTRWETLPAADREEFAQAALGLCRNARAQGRESRFYWANANTICMINESEQPADFFGGPTPDGAKAIFALADLANRTAFEIWMEPRLGEESYRMAGR